MAPAGFFANIYLKYVLNGICASSKPTSRNVSYLPKHQASSQKCRCRSHTLWRRISRKQRRGQRRLSVMSFPFLPVFFFNLFHLYRSHTTYCTTLLLFIQITLSHLVSSESSQIGISSAREGNALTEISQPATVFPSFLSDSVTTMERSHRAGQPKVAAHVRAMH